jgi:hypothetical protein
MTEYRIVYAERLRRSWSLPHISQSKTVTFGEEMPGKPPSATTTIISHEQQSSRAKALDCCSPREIKSLVTRKVPVIYKRCPLKIQLALRDLEM